MSSFLMRYKTPILCAFSFMMGALLMNENTGMRSSLNPLNTIRASSVQFNTRLNAPEPPRNVYIDLGANDGRTLLYVTEKTGPEEGLNHDGGKGVHIPMEATVKGSKWTVIAVEPNTRYQAALEGMEDTLFQSGKVEAYHLYAKTAITTFDGNVTFMLDTPEGDAGASIMSDSFSVQGKGKREVAAVDIVTLFNKHKIREEDYVVVKMDIEGAEFDVVKRIIFENLYKKIDVMAVEWHHTNILVLGKVHEKYDKVYEALTGFFALTNVTMLDWGR